MSLADRLLILTAMDKSPHHELFAKHGFSQTGVGYEKGEMRPVYFAVPHTHDKRPLEERAVGLRRDLKAKGYVQTRTNSGARNWTHPKQTDTIHYYNGQVLHRIPSK